MKKTIMMVIFFLFFTVSTIAQVEGAYIYVPIADGQTFTGAFSRRGGLISIIPNTGMEGTTIMLHSAVALDSTYYPLESGGAIYVITLTVGSDIIIPPDVAYGLNRFVKIETGTVQTGANFFRCSAGSYP